MGQDFCAAHSKTHEDSISKCRTKKVDNLHAPSLSTSNKGVRFISPPATEREENVGGASSSTDSSIRSAQSIIRKSHEENSTLGVGENGNGGKKRPKKLMHARDYKKLLSNAKTDENQGGTNGCIKEKGSLENVLIDLKKNALHEVSDGNQDEKELCVQTIMPPKKNESKTTNLSTTLNDSFPDAINQGHQTKLDGSKCERATSNLELQVEPSREEVCNHESCKELTTRNHGFCDEEFLGNPDQRMADENACVVPNFVISSSQNFITLKHNLCRTCKQPGQLIWCCGKGCKRSYHPSCVNLPDIPPGAWLCTYCVKKKNVLGAHSVSDGIESICDVNEGMQSGKQYFVKYKGIAHAHNRWISEDELLHDAPLLFAQFRKGQKQVTRWKKEWTEPERFVYKRLVASPEVTDEDAFVSNIAPLHCCNEWFVKWKGLHYDQASWELESSLLLLSSETPRLIEDYAHRLEHANRSYGPETFEKGLQVKKAPFCKLSKLPDGCNVELNKDYLTSINSLREFWHKSLNAVLFDGQDRITSSILFILSLQSHACRPFLILTTSGSLRLWQADFQRLAPSLNVVAYEGDKNARKIIQNIEFYEKTGQLMFQVLLADPKAIVEDLDDITYIGWESIIIDKCQSSKTAAYLEQLNAIKTDFKLLLFTGPLKDNLSEYRSLLSFLNNDGTVDDSLVGLKEKFSHHIAFKSEIDSSKFVEYWVPAPLSAVQLEQYCAILLSNANVLRSNSRSEVVGALRNILLTTRKCCDHPYLVDGELRTLLTKGFQGGQVLNAEVCASGKLYLLGKILQEMKGRGLRVVILFQSLGEPGKVSLGDILDDLLLQQFGGDSYERIQNGMIMSKKLDALKKYNSKEAGLFAFLIEKRACQSNVVLRSVDVIVIFDSDWNPLNDIRSLQKIKIESQNSSIRVFRLYTCYTVEERILMLAKQDVILENSIDNISRNIIHSVLGWGVSYLFQKLHLLHSNTGPAHTSEASFTKISLNDVVSEVIAQLPENDVINSTVPTSILIKTQLIGGTYSSKNVLVGEKEGIVLPGKDLPSFWSGLLEGRHPKWIHISEHSQNIRKRVQNVNGLAIQSAESDEIKNKRQKINTVVDSVTLPDCAQENIVAAKEVYGSCVVDSNYWELKLGDQRKFLMLLKPELSELSDILELPESVKSTAEEFLVYIMNNHDVCLDKITLLQALKISLCWRAASMSGHKLDHAESLATAKAYLNFECTDMEAKSVYSKLKILEEKYPFQSSALESLRWQSIYNHQPYLSKSVNPGSKPLQPKAKETTVSNFSGLGANSTFPVGLNQGHCLIGETPGAFQLGSEPLKDDFVRNQVDLVEHVFLKRSKDLDRKQQAEISNFDKQVYEDRIQLEKANTFDLELICTIHVDSTVKNGKKGVIANKFSTKLEKFLQHLKEQKQKLMSLQLDIRNKEQELKYSWLKKAKTTRLDKSLDDLPLLETSFRLERFVETTDSNNFEAICPNSCPSYVKNCLSGGSLQIPSAILNVQEEVVEVGDVLPSTSVILESFEQNEQKTEYVEPSHLVDPSRSLTGISAQSEVLIPIPELNQAAVFSSVQVVPKSDSFTSEIQDLSTDEHRRHIVAATTRAKDYSHELILPESHLIATQLPHSEVTCNEMVPSNSSPCQLPLFEPVLDNIPLLGCQEVASQSCSFVEQTEVPGQPESRTVGLECDVANNQIKENVIYPLRPQEYLTSEGNSSENLRSTDIQEHAEVPVEEAVETVVTETEPSIQQMHENACHPIPPENILQPTRHQEDLNLERTHSEDLPETAIQADQQNHLLQNPQLLEWVPLQTMFTDPMQNELHRLQNQEYSCTMKHENKKLQLQSECEQEVQKVRRKYDALLLSAEMDYLNERMVYKSFYQKILWHQAFAEEARTEYFDQVEGLLTSGVQCQNTSQLPQEHHPQELQCRSEPSPTVVPPPPATSTINQVIPTTRSRVPAQLAVSSSQTPPIITTHTIHRPITQLPTHHVGRSPAPHLQRFRQSVSLPTTPSSSIWTPASISPTYGASQPSISRTTPLHFSAPPISQPPPLQFSTPPISQPPPLQFSTPPISQPPPLQFSAPPISRPPPLQLSAPPLELPPYSGTDDLLESMLADFPATWDDESPQQVIDWRHNPSTAVISLSDEE